MRVSVGRNLLWDETLWSQNVIWVKMRKIQNLNSLPHLDEWLWLREGREGRAELKVCWNSLSTASRSLREIDYSKFAKFGISADQWQMVHRGPWSLFTFWDRRSSRKNATRRIWRTCGFCAISAISAKQLQLGPRKLSHSITLVSLPAVALTLKPQKRHEAHYSNLRYLRHQRHLRSQRRATATRTSRCCIPSSILKNPFEAVDEWLQHTFQFFVTANRHSLNSSPCIE